MLDFSNPFAPFSQSRVSDNNKECNSLKLNGSGFIQGAPIFSKNQIVKYSDRLLSGTEYFFTHKMVKVLQVVWQKEYNYY